MLDDVDCFWVCAAGAPLSVEWRTAKSDDVLSGCVAGPKHKPGGPCEENLRLAIMAAVVAVAVIAVGAFSLTRLTNVHASGGGATEYVGSTVGNNTSCASPGYARCRRR